MSKIVIAVNVMLSNPKKISEVIETPIGAEIFFRYDRKHKWSIIESGNGSHTLIYYPGPQALEYLAQLDPDEWGNVKMVSYRAEDIGTREALSSFAELYSVVKEKLFGMDEVLDDIIDSDIPF